MVLLLSPLGVGMGWFLCTGGSGNHRNHNDENTSPVLHLADVKNEINSMNSDANARPDGNSAEDVPTFTYAELAAATNNFRDDCFLGQGGFGRVYKGRLRSTDQIVAIKQLDRNGLQGNKEFLVEVFMLNLVHHPNLVNLVGYCAEANQRLLVYEYMALGSLEDHLFISHSKKKPLDWITRMKIAEGAARGLEYLHNKAKPPVIYRDMKCSNILLGEGFYPKLSDFGLAKLGPTGDRSHVSTRVMGTYGYCAPEYAMTGKLTTKSDIYSFGIVLLEILTGRRAIDNDLPNHQRNLVTWARPYFSDRKRFRQIADPTLRGEYPSKGLYQALAVSAMCVNEQPTMRPPIEDVVTALSYLVSHADDPDSAPGTSNVSCSTTAAAASGIPRPRTR